MATTASEVRLIMNVTTATLSDAQIAPFIVAGDEIVAQVFEDDTELTATLLAEIKKWMVAHMIASTIYRTTSDEKLGDASVKYTGKWGMRLESTPYGQMVLVLDMTGRMANAGKMRASIFAVKGFE
jgi:hypothetical protein